MSETAVLIIDVQRAIIDGPPPAHDGQAVMERLARLADRARAAGVPVIHVQHQDGELVYGTPGWEIHPTVAPRAGEPVVAKTECDAFYQTPLADLLAERGTRHLVMGGCQTDWCVQTTCRRALKLGYRVTLLADGHTTCDNEQSTAAETIARYNRELEALGATLCGADEVVFG